MPLHLQFNQHIHTGYRPLSLTPRESLSTIFYVHNETVNILTHGLAILYVLLTVPFLLPWAKQGILGVILSLCHLIGAISPWIGSSVYHIFMNLDYGVEFYRQLLQIDMLGIWLCQSFGALPMVMTAVHCQTDNVWYCCVGAYCILSYWGLLKAMHADSPWERRLCFMPPFMARMLILCLRTLGISGGDPEALLHIVLQDLLAVIGAIIGALRVPEKWIPGKVDYMMNSHNLMHVMVVLAVYSMHTATILDLAWMANPSSCIA
ncbi:progestin and adipoQ receptor family member 4 [Prorops nasuta]|uniref:progestin and adipoQ receptor family member 4 n=1 Tax=Prorops nasuta TaxID=863751 RepID=UPI0034CECFC3